MPKKSKARTIRELIGIIFKIRSQLNQEIKSFQGFFQVVCKQLVNTRETYKTIFQAGLSQGFVEVNLCDLQNFEFYN